MAQYYSKLANGSINVAYPNKYVGIGTTNPNSLLTVTDSGGTGLEFNPQDAYNRNIIFSYKRSTGQYKQLDFNANDFVFTTCGVDTRMVIKSTGLVGIGTTNPYTKLQVDNTLGIYSTDTTTGGQIYLGSSDFYNANYYNSAPGIGAIISTGCSQPNGLGFYVYNGSANSRVERMRIENNGYVGIGTTNPDYKLHIYDTTIAQWSLHNSERRAILTNNANDNLLSLSYDGNNRLQFNLTNQYFPLGNLGLGTASPSNKLTVVNSDTDTTPTALLQNSSTGDASLHFNVSGRSYTIGIDNSDDDKFKIARNNDLGTTDRLTIDGDGNVGIGTTSPAYKLDVSGSGTLATSSDVRIGYPNTCEDQDSRLIVSYPALSGVPYDFITLASTVNNAEQTGRIVWKNRYETSSFATGQEASFIGSYRCSSAGCYSLIFGTTGSNASDAVERVRIDHNGNVGIGTTNPDTPLHIWSTGTATPVFKAERDDTSDFITMDFGAGEANLASSSPFNLKYGAIKYLTFSGADNSLRLGCNLNLTVTSVGWVGIGTTNAIGSLHIKNTSTSGAISGTNPSLVFNIQNGSIGAGSYYGNIRWGRPNSNGGTPSLGIIARSDSSNPASVAHLAFYTEQGTSCTLTERMVIENGGNVGIGTTSPNAPLEIYSSSNETLRIAASDSQQASIGFAQGTTNKWLVGVDLNANGGEDFFIYDANASQNRVIINNAGDVGIGTINPREKLNIDSGNFVFTASKTGDADIQSIIWHNTNSTGFDVAKIVGKTGTNIYEGIIRFETKDSGGTMAERMRITSAGNVGIGTTDPDRQFQVLGGTADNSSTTIRIGGSTNHTSTIELAESVYSGVMSYGYSLITDGGSAGSGTNNFLLKNHNNSSVGDVALSVGRVNGYVGIGTTTPNERLTIFCSSDTSGTTTGTTLLGLKNYVGSDIEQQKTFIDFTFTDGNTNETPQVRIGAEVGPNSSANTQEKEGEGAFVVYTNDATQTSGAATGLVERMRVDYAGNVGIGTSNPESNLQIGTLTSTSTATPKVLSLGGTYSNCAGSNPKIRLWDSCSTSYMGFGISSSTLEYILTQTNWKHVFYAAGSPLMTILGTGNVGIGTTSPVTKLHVSASASGDAANLLLTNTNDTNGDTASIQFSMTDTALYNKAAIYFERTALQGEGSLHLATSNTGNSTSVTKSDARLTITKDGYVGIGTTSPGALLTLKGQGHTTPTFAIHRTYSTDNQFCITLAENSAATTSRGTSTGQWANVIDSANSNLFLTTFNGGGTGGSIVLDANNVGIGITNPADKLHIQNSGTSGGIKLSNSGADNYILFSNGANNWYLSQDGNDNSGSPNSFQINRDGSTYVMITSAGDVGIGTTQPTNRFEIDLPSGETFKTCRSASAWFSLSHGAATTVMCNGGELQIHATNSTVSSLRVNSSLITLNEHTISNCCVGIGTSAPTAWLQVGQNTDNDATDYGICIAKNGTSACPGTYQPSALKIQDYAGDGPSSGVDIDGIVGIHSTRLTYADTNAANVSYFLVKEDSAYSPMRLDGKGNLWLGYDRGTQPTNAGTWNLITRGGLVVGSSYQSNYPGGGNAIISGCVGIGTNSPNAKLEISGDTRSGGRILYGGTESNYLTGVSYASIYGTADTFESVSGLFGSLVLQSRSNTARPIIFVTGATPSEKMRLTSDGNLGIGITNPTEKLHVCGNISGCCVITGAIHERNLRTLEIKGSTEGTVLIWENGKAVPSYNEYDSRVLGIVGKDSPDPIVMGAEPVLITGSINEGDFIVTSNVSGHGMRAEENGRNLFGKVIGQALQAGDGDSHTIMAMIRKL